MAGAVERLDRAAAEVGRSLDDARRATGRLRTRLWPPEPPRAAPGSLPPLSGWSHGTGVPVVAVLVYRGVSSSEVEMVADALARPLEATVRLVSADPGPVVAVEPARTIVAEPLAAATRPYGLVVPGGLAWRREASRAEVVGWLGEAVGAARGVIAVSTGSLLLAATGALEGQEAASHWLAGDLLSELGASPSAERVVHHRLLVTAAGALAGTEAAQRLAKEMRFSF